jgi:RNA polymerase sigma-70 factor, ECF subfamily
MSYDGESKADRILREAFRQRMALLAYAQAMLRDPGAAEDVVQEAYLVAVKKAEQFEEGTSVLSWCKAIVRLEILKHRSRRHAESKVVQQLLDDAIDTAFEKFQQADTADADEQRHRLKDCLQLLTSRSQQVVAARFRDNLSYQDVADKFEMHIEAVRKLLYRAKQQLRKCMELRPSKRAQS